MHIPPQANTGAAVAQLFDTVTQAEHSHPDSIVIVAGDFNKANPKKEMPKFAQQVTCVTRDDKILDHCYTTIRGAFLSIPRAPLGRSDHAMVYLVPTYKQQLKCVKPTVKTVKQRSLDAVESLRCCFECTDWGAFKEAAADIHEYTESVSDYITFCEGLCIPTKTIKIYHNKPWFKTDIKHKLQAKQEADKGNDKDKYKQARYAAEKAIKTTKANYREKLEENITTNNPRYIWQGLKAITNCKPSSKSADITDTTLPENLNDFYSRFDKQNTISPPSVAAFHCNISPFTIDESVVKRMFERLNSRKAAGPDNVSPCLLKQCAGQLSGVFTDIFNVSLSQCIVPQCFKRSSIIPVPKKCSVSCLNDYRHVALISVVMKTLERLVQQFLKSIIDPMLDRFQFAYRGNRFVDDAVSLGLFYVLKNLEGPDTYAGILFVDYSSAFNTIIISKLL